MVKPMILCFPMAKSVSSQIISGNFGDVLKYLNNLNDSPALDI